MPPINYNEGDSVKVERPLYNSNGDQIGTNRVHGTIQEIDYPNQMVVVEDTDTKLHHRVGTNRIEPDF